MAYTIDLGAWNGIFALPNDVVDKHLKLVGRNALKVLLYLMRHSGELMAHIPSQVNLLPEKPQYASLAVPFRTVVRNAQLGVALGRLWGKLAAKCRVRKLNITGDSGIALEYSHKYTRVFMPNIGTREYDLAVSFLTPHYFVAEKVRAKKKIAWIHTDYTMVSVDRVSELAMWERYDYIASISDTVTDSFLKCFPSLENRIVLIENILPESVIRWQTDAFNAALEMSAEKTRLLSIGRFCYQKNFDNVPDICARLLKMGLDVCWYLIGFGGDEALIRQKIREAGMEDHVILLGKRDNPYPYIKACDVYVQPSRYEGKAVTVREAQMLCKPVIITNYATAPSQLIDGVDGITVPMGNEGCAQGIAALLRDHEEMTLLSENCRLRDYSNGGHAEKLLELLK